MLSLFPPLSSGATDMQAAAETWPRPRSKSSQRLATPRRPHRLLEKCEDPPLSMSKVSTPRSSVSTADTERQVTPRRPHRLPPMATANRKRSRPSTSEDPPLSASKMSTPRSSVGTVDVSEPALRERISHMKALEVKDVVQSITGMRCPDRVLCHAFAARVGELINRTPLHALGHAADNVLLIEQYPRLFSAFNVTGSFRHMLEVRLETLLHQTAIESSENGSVIEVLIYKYEQASELVSRGLVAARLQTLAKTNLHRWVEHAPLIQLQRELSEVARAVQVDQSLASSLEMRFVGVQLITLSFDQLRSLASTLIDLHSCGVQVLGSQLEVAFAKQLQTLIKAWARTRLSNELQSESGLLTLCRASKVVHKAVRLTLSKFLSHWIAQLIGSFTCIDNLERLKSEFAQWCNLLQLADSAELVVFGASTRDAFLEVFCSCANRCIETSELRPALDAVKQMHWQVMVLVGGGLARENQMSDDAAFRAYGTDANVTEASVVVETASDTPVKDSSSVTDVSPEPCNSVVCCD